MNIITEKNRKFYIPNDGKMKLQFFHVEDLCKVIEKILDLSSKGISTAKIAAELKLSISTINRIERAHS